jgi:glycosyltransferase involved in cell wall biosynthesis
MIGSAPTGIDRVEHAYATEIIGKPADIDSVGVITTPLFTGALRKPLIREVLDRVALAWKIESAPQEDALYLKLKEYLETPVQLDRTQSFRVADLPLLQRTRDQAIFPVRSLARASIRLKRWIRRGTGGPNFYLNSSHTQLEKLERFEWTEAASIKCVFFIHDLIPIDFPEYVSPSSPARHEGRLNTVSRLASGIIVNSEYTARSVAAYLDAHKVAAPPIEVIPLGVTEWFLDKSNLQPPWATVPYFVNVSTIEPRKNMLLLFAVWRRLIEILGPATPRLVLVGHRGWENENVIDVLDRSKGLAPFLVEASGLSDAGLASLIRGATAVVAPSSVEGFGLPVAEALSLGVPVIASDIPAHREVGGRWAAFIDPIDGLTWVRTIKGFVEAGSQQREKAVEMAQDYRPLKLAEHVVRATAFVHTISEKQRAAA